MKYEPPYDEYELLLQLSAGSEAAFAKIYHHYRFRIYGAALKILKSTVLAEEIVQDVFLKVWLKRSTMVNVRQFDAFVFVMARNLIFDRLKKAAYESNAQPVVDPQLMLVNDTDQQLIQRQYQQLLQKAVDLLPPQQKQIYHLAKIEGLSHEAIAVRMNLSKLTVKTHMAKALQTLRKHLNDHLHEWVCLLIVVAH